MKKRELFPIKPFQSQHEKKYKFTDKLVPSIEIKNEKDYLAWADKHIGLNTIFFIGQDTWKRKDKVESLSNESNSPYSRLCQSAFLMGKTWFNKERFLFYPEFFGLKWTWSLNQKVLKIGINKKSNFCVLAWKNNNKIQSMIKKKIIDIENQEIQLTRSFSNLSKSSFDQEINYLTTNNITPILASSLDEAMLIYNQKNKELHNLNPEI